jgi:hypothetical protein
MHEDVRGSGGIASAFFNSALLFYPRVSIAIMAQLAKEFITFFGKQRLIALFTMLSLYTVLFGKRS